MVLWVLGGLSWRCYVFPGFVLGYVCSLFVGLVLRDVDVVLWFVSLLCCFFVRFSLPLWFISCSLS